MVFSFFMTTRFQPTGPNPVAFRDLGYNSSSDSPGPLDASNHAVGRLWFPTSSKKLWNGAWLPHQNYSYGGASALLLAVKGWKGTVLKAIVIMFSRIFGETTALAATPDGALSPAADDPSSPALMPIAIVSHGLFGIRTTYSSLCLELASRGWLVVSVEHADGTAAAVHLHGKFSNSSEIPGVQGDWRFYTPLGVATNLKSEESPKRVAYRVDELLQVRRLLEQLNLGEQVPGLHISGADTINLKGRLDMSRVIMIGHSFGGASVVKLAADHPGAAAAVIALDPWWECLPADFSALNGSWKSPAPMQIIGSHLWNHVNDDKGTMWCGGEKRNALIAAAGKGPGAVLLVPKGSRHNTFSDIALYSPALGKMVEPSTTNLGSEMLPADCLNFSIKSILKFVQDHVQGPPGKAASVPVTADDKAQYEALFGAALFDIVVSHGAGSGSAAPAASANVSLSVPA